ncbi:glycoside hydrolase family 88 protein [Parapedobacter sp. ISTM3]|uniref:glycoside hydrolase family 88 protein n=1 Tax=Parapedobacter sp. ISTM3 TaxID=2800130 RepID=UPI001F330B61|nr:glycoside hydrolase family 88 protein [Parapedobacter sp. ISTM3]
MKYTPRYIIGATLVCFQAMSAPAQDIPGKEQVVEIIHRVNEYWQSLHKPQEWAFWDVAAYHTGNMAAYEATGNAAYRDYSEAWASHNQWKGAKSDDRSTWKYHYGESDEHVLFGDWQICFQTYIDLFHLDPDSAKIRRAMEVIEYQMSTPNEDYWWWADGLYMVMPVMTKLYHVTGNTQYLEKLLEYFSYAKALMYDDDEHLFYRDAKYVYPKHKSVNGKKDFWARGDGWVFAGLAKVLQDLPADYQHRAEFETVYRDMAGAIMRSQQAEGYWTRSILDPEHAPGPETSGTAFFTYGLFWGVNNGYLDPATYTVPAIKGWQYLATFALQPDGRVGYVQPIGERAIPGQTVDANSTANFGVGAFLLAATELLDYVERRQDSVFAFSYFKGNGEDGLHLAYSYDGFKWAALNNDQSFLKPELSDDKLMRDPCIIRGGDGRFHMVWTVSWTDRGIGYASSDDLIHWSEQQYIPVMAHEPDARNCWAPEITYDPDRGIYMIYWATTIRGRFPETQIEADNGYNHRMYYVTTSDFKTFSETKLFYDPGFNVIDATIARDGNRWVMFLKDETREPAQKNLKVAYAESMEGPYSKASEPITGDYWAEGPTAGRVGGEWVVYFDKYIMHRYGAIASRDLVNWREVSEKLAMPDGIRHGTVFKISREELARLEGIQR